jgi:hypothetical protein
MLSRHPVFRASEVRKSGRGLHVLIWFEEPLNFKSSAERERWTLVVRIIQRLLPSDPACPGITALTRPLGSINSKNGQPVRQLRAGRPIKAADVLTLADIFRKEPFRTAAGILFGDSGRRPCPICRGADCALFFGPKSGQCYTRKKPVTLAELFACFMVESPTKGVDQSSAAKGGN